MFYVAFGNTRALETCSHSAESKLLMEFDLTQVTKGRVMHQLPMGDVGTCGYHALDLAAVILHNILLQNRCALV